MPINFHDEKNRHLYGSRSADETWKHVVHEFVNPVELHIADIGCGGGIYSRAWADLGAASVIGVDSSQVMVDAAWELCSGTPNVSFMAGDAIATGVNDTSVDLVFERALIHHLTELGAAMAETYRILDRSGYLMIQDRTPEDVVLPGSAEHIRAISLSAFRSCSPLNSDVAGPGNKYEPPCLPQDLGMSSSGPCGRRDGATLPFRSWRRTCGTERGGRSSTS